MTIKVDAYLTDFNGTVNSWFSSGQLAKFCKTVQRFP
jgi:hypothetical protein